MGKLRLAENLEILYEKSPKCGECHHTAQTVKLWILLHLIDDRSTTSKRLLGTNTPNFCKAPGKEKAKDGPDGQW